MPNLQTAIDQTRTNRNRTLRLRQTCLAGVAPWGRINAGLELGLVARNASVQLASQFDHKAVLPPRRSKSIVRTRSVLQKVCRAMERNAEASADRNRSSFLGNLNDMDIGLGLEQVLHHFKHSTSTPRPRTGSSPAKPPEALRWIFRNQPWASVRHSPAFSSSEKGARLFPPHPRKILLQKNPRPNLAESVTRS